MKKSSLIKAAVIIINVCVMLSVITSCKVKPINTPNSSSEEANEGEQIVYSGEDPTIVPENANVDVEFSFDLSNLGKEIKNVVMDINTSILEGNGIRISFQSLIRIILRKDIPL